MFLKQILLIFKEFGIQLENIIQANNNKKCSEECSKAHIPYLPFIHSFLSLN